MMTSIQLPLGSPFVDMYSCRLVAWKRHILRCLYLVPFEFVPTLGFVDEATGMAWVVPGCFSVLIDIALTTPSNVPAHSLLQPYRPQLFKFDSVNFPMHPPPSQKFKIINVNISNVNIYTFDSLASESRH
jgi:hypothetical protein